MRFFFEGNLSQAAGLSTLPDPGYSPHPLVPLPNPGESCLEGPASAGNPRATLPEGVDTLEESKVRQSDVEPLDEESVRSR